MLDNSIIPIIEFRYNLSLFWFKMDTIDTISQLLSASNSQFRLYDIGRKIEKISKDLFKKIELNQVPYPNPTQGHACIAIVFWQQKSPQPYLWLLKLPLDERGLLNQGARNHFVAIIVEALGSDLTQEANKQQEELLKNNPYLFTPAQYKLAALNSKIKRSLKQAPSEYLEPFVTYLNDSNDWSNWQAVGVQGITDFAIRINDKNNTNLLIKALPHLPNEVLFPLCSALENESFSVELIEALLSLFNYEETKIKNTTAKSTIERTKFQQHVLRSLASNSSHVHVKSFITNLLEQKNITSEILITLSGRCWLALTESEQLMVFFEHLIHADNQPLFNSIFKDLVAIPIMRPIVFQCMRSPQRSEKLSHAIGQLFN